MKLFLAWCEDRKLELVRVTPKDVGQYMDGLRKRNLGVATRKQHLAALRHFLDGLVTRHAILLNPALSVRGEDVQRLAGHADPRTTRPYDRTSDEITLDEVERIAI